MSFCFRQATQAEMDSKAGEFFGDGRMPRKDLVAFVLEHENQIKAFGGFVKEGKVAALTSFVVAEKCRRKGYGRLLFRHLVHEIRSRGFEAITVITHLWEPLVEKEGFYLTGRDIQSLLRGSYVEKLPHFEEMMEVERAIR